MRAATMPADRSGGAQQPTEDDDQRPKKQARSSVKDKFVTAEEIKAHLVTTFFIGYKPGDPTADPPLDTLPPPVLRVAPEAQSIRLADWSHERLLAEAASTIGFGSNPESVLLKIPPGVPPERVAYISGQAPLYSDIKDELNNNNNKSSALPGSGGLEHSVHGGSGSGSLVAAAPVIKPLEVLAKYLGTPGERLEVPWCELGIMSPPQVEGKDLSLRRLWDLVTLEGGSETTSEGKRWEYIAGNLGARESGATDAATIVQEWYSRYLLEYEKKVRKT